MLMTTLKLKRGTLDKLRYIMTDATLRLADGEPYFSKDLKSLFISDATGFYRVGNVLVGTQADRTIYEEKGTLYFVTDTKRYKNTLWCHDGSKWVSVGSAQDEVDFETIRLKAYGEVKSGDHVVAWFTGSDDRAFAVSAANASSIPSVDNTGYYSVVSDPGTFSRLSNLSIPFKYNVTAWVLSSGTEIRIRVWNFSPDRTVNVLDASSFSVTGATQQVNTVYDEQQNTVIVTYLVNDGGNNYKINKLIGLAEDDGITFTHLVGSNTYSIDNINNAYTNCVTDNLGNVLFLYLNNGYVNGVLMKQDNNTLTEVSNNVVSSTNGHSELKVYYDPKNNKYIWISKSASNGKYSYIYVDGTSLVGTSDYNYCTFVPNSHDVYYDHKLEKVIVIYNISSGIRGRSFAWNGTTYALGNEVTVSSVLNTVKISCTKLNSGDVVIAWDTNAPSFGVVIGKMYDSNFTVSFNMDNIGSYSLIPFTSSIGIVLNKMVQIFVNNAITVYGFAYSSDANTIIPVDDCRVTIGVAMEDAQNGDEVQVRLWKCFQNPVSKYIAGTFYAWNASNYEFNPMSYNNIGFSEVFAIADNCLVSI